MVTDFAKGRGKVSAPDYIVFRRGLQDPLGGPAEKWGRDELNHIAGGGWVWPPVGHHGQ